MDTAQMKKILPFLVRGICLLLLLPMNVLFVWQACQKPTERFPSFLFGKDGDPSMKKIFYAEFENGVCVMADYGDDQTTLEAIAGRRAFSIYAGEENICVFRTNLDDRRGAEKPSWFEDMLMLPSGNVCYHDSWFLDYNGDLQFDMMSDVKKGKFIRIGDKWEACRMELDNRRIATMPDGRVWKWNGTNWSRPDGGDLDVEENQTNR